MTDSSSLDDFFAKKDKSKKKQKSKIKYGDVTNYTNTEENSPFVPLTKDKLQKKEKSQSGLKMPDENDEEWLDFEEKTEKDYSGLRIQNIQISNRVDSENEGDGRDGGDDADGDERGDKDDANTGPWNKATPVTETPTQPPEPVEPKTTEPQKSNKYIPPSLRANAASKPLASKPKKKGAPDIRNAEEFPTLGTEPPVEWTSQSKSFEAVRSGGKQVDSSNDTPQLTLQNKFAALS